MSEIFLSRNFEPKGSQEFFLDNSVLLFAFAPIGGYNQKVQNSVARFLGDCKRIGSGLHVTSLVLSEFTGKVFRDFWDEYKSKPENAGKDSLKKDYRSSKDFKENAEAINAAVKNILKLCSRFPDSFHSINVDVILENHLYVDFNDAYFIELCNEKDWIIVSRDKDIINSAFRVNPVLSFLDV
jgi:hypothetical protein